MFEENDSPFIGPAGVQARTYVLKLSRADTIACLPWLRVPPLCGCAQTLCLLWQVLDLVEDGNAAKSGLIAKGDQLVGVTGCVA